MRRKHAVPLCLSLLYSSILHQHLKCLVIISSRPYLSRTSVIMIPLQHHPPFGPYHESYVPTLAPILIIPSTYSTIHSLSDHPLFSKAFRHNSSCPEAHNEYGPLHNPSHRLFGVAFGATALFSRVALNLYQRRTFYRQGLCTCKRNGCGGTKAKTRRRGYQGGICRWTEQ